MDPLVEKGEERNVGSGVMFLGGKELLKLLTYEGS